MGKKVIFKAYFKPEAVTFMLTFITMELVSALVRRPSDLESERFFALGLPPDDDDADSAKQAQDDAGHHDLRVSG